MTSINSQHPTTQLPDFNARTRREAGTTGSTQQVQTSSAARLTTAPLNDSDYAAMYDTLQKMTPPPTLEAIRAQVPNAVWDAKQRGQSYGLDALLLTPMATDMGLKLRELHGDLLPGMDDLSWASVALTVLFTQGMFGDPGNIAEFDFDSRGNNTSDTMAATMFSRLKQHLVEQHLKDTGAKDFELAGAIAFLLLWRSSPEYLLRDIPAYENRFSHQWEQVRREVKQMSEKHDRFPLGASYESILDALDPQREIDRRSQF